jgi:nucleoside-diphosphate-sugar epimerase
MRVFVTGATWFIGRSACRSLTAAEHEVIGLAHDEARAGALEKLGVRVIVGTLDDPGTFLAQLDRHEAIVHLAAAGFDGPETIEQARRNGERILAWTRPLARLAVESKSRIIVFAGNNQIGSADAGPQRPVGYDRILGPAQTYIETATGVPLMVLVPGWVYGAGSWFPGTVRQIQAGQTHHLIGDAEVDLRYVEVGDVGEAFRLAAEKCAAGTSFNVVDEELGVPAARGVSPASQDIGPTRRELGCPFGENRHAGNSGNGGQSANGAGQGVSVSVSAGVATFPNNDRIVEPHDLTQAADLALYPAKELRRNRMHLDEKSLVSPY